MKRTIVIMLAMTLLAVSAFAQNDVNFEVDSTYATQNAVDSTLAGKDIFRVLSESHGYYSHEGKVEIDQPQSVARAMSAHIAANADKKMTGYRVRIFFDNQQTARAKSESVASAFRAQHPGVGVYREYENPYFKVTVGDFRTKSDARKFLNSIKGAYPSGFIVREKINYPIL